MFGEFEEPERCEIALGSSSVSEAVNRRAHDHAWQYVPACPTPRVVLARYLLLHSENSFLAAALIFLRFLVEHSNRDERKIVDQF